MDDKECFNLSYDELMRVTETALRERARLILGADTITSSFEEAKAATLLEHWLTLALLECSSTAPIEKDHHRLKNIIYPDNPVSKAPR